MRQNVLMPRATAATTLAALALAGCGSSSGAENQFAARANAVCVRAQERGKRLKAPGASAEGSLRFIEQASALLAQAGRELAAVEPPASKQTAYARFVAATRHEVALLRQDVAALRAKDVKREGKALAAMRANTVNAQASALGLTKCAGTIEPAGG